MRVGRIILESLGGFAVALVSFVAGLCLASIIPDSGVKWLNERGELIVGWVMLWGCFFGALLLRFKWASLIVSVGYISALLCALREFLWNWHYTVLPIGIAALLVALVRGVQTRIKPEGTPLWCGVIVAVFFISAVFPLCFAGDLVEHFAEAFGLNTREYALETLALLAISLSCVGFFIGRAYRIWRLKKGMNRSACIGN